MNAYTTRKKRAEVPTFAKHSISKLFLLTNRNILTTWKITKLFIKRAHIATIHFHSLSHALACFDIHEHWRVKCLLQNTCTYNALQMPSWGSGKIYQKLLMFVWQQWPVFLQATLLCSWPVSREVPYTKDTKTQSIANTWGHLLKKQAQPWRFKSKFLNAISFNYTIEWTNAWNHKQLKLKK